ncbi:helix-turn-helix domain-containing protein [Cohnella caldifontis]|uniref:helix-turn-helix domain-containing protein n=1 Tax=Cohnella caldifontis TaxID=3027471 RepID=UPI0023EB6218|nr:helix-turn-helix domain-containing protein [Cohnella sp. YIM B05605]
MIDAKQQQIMNKIDVHLRKTARRLVQFDTLDETLHYLIDSFHQQFACDFMAILTIDNGTLAVKAKKGDAAGLEPNFPLPVERCCAELFQRSYCSFDSIKGKETCVFLTSLDNENFQSWFTIPILHETGSCLGLCVIAFRSFVPLVLEADKLFLEYGRDIATAFALARHRENEFKKIKGLDWLKENLYSLEQIVENIVERAGKGTGARSASIYLYDETSNELLLQRPVYGASQAPRKIDLHERYDLKSFFSHLEKPGGPEITIPLTVNLKLIGVLHVTDKEPGAFTREDLELLTFLSSHVSAVIENARLYLSERERQTRLETYMNYQYDLVKHTVEEDGFSNISKSLSNMMGCPVFLFDRFFHVTSVFSREDESPCHDRVIAAVRQHGREVSGSRRLEHWLDLDDNGELGLWKVMGGGELLGYLGLAMPRKHLDIVLRMTLNHALNVYAVQFIKQKLVLDVREQVKDGFFNQLFTQDAQNKPKVMEYANLLNWDLSKPHCIGLFTFRIDPAEDRNPNVLEWETEKNRIWDRVRDEVSRKEPGLILTRKDAYYLVIVPKEKTSGDFWDRFHVRIRKILDGEWKHVSFYLGISQEAKEIEEYYLGYKQAQKTLSILINRFPRKPYMSFHQLGSYTVLYHMDDPLAGTLFIKTYLEPLLTYGKNRDLFDTLRVYLMTNGNIKDAAGLLFIHRSSLKYRLEKIREVLNVDIDDAEQRFNLLLAYKLHDLQGGEPHGADS